MKYDTRPGGLDGPPLSRRTPKTWHKIVGWSIIGPPLLLVAVLSVWAVAWLFAHWPS